MPVCMCFHAPVSQPVSWWLCISELAPVRIVDNDTVRKRGLTVTDIQIYSHSHEDRSVLLHTGQR